MAPGAARASDSSSPASDPLIAALLPVILHRINNATQILAGVNALVAHAGEPRSRDLSEDVARASDEIRELGWLLAVIASAGGCDLLLERRERDGLARLVGAVRDALRRQRRDLASMPEIPEASPGVADGWQLPWAIASFLWRSAASLDEGSSLVWRIARQGDAWRVSAAVRVGARERDAIERSVSDRLAGAVVRAEDGELALELPGDWLC